MKPYEFWNSTYREIFTFVNSNSLQREEEYKQEIILFDALGEKLLGVLATRHPRNVSLVRNTFKELFKEELNPSKGQTIEEQIRILRSMK